MCPHRQRGSYGRLGCALCPASFVCVGSPKISLSDVDFDRGSSENENAGKVDFYFLDLPVQPSAEIVQADWTEYW